MNPTDRLQDNVGVCCDQSAPHAQSQPQVPPRDDTARRLWVRRYLRSALIGDTLDALGRTHQFLPHEIRPIRDEMFVVGRAMPVLIGDTFGSPKDPFGRLTEALDQLAEGDIYLARQSSAPCAAWGEILTATARSRGAVGAVIDGFHRDTWGIVEQEWPVFSRGSFAQDARVRTKVLDFRVTIEIDGVSVRPGDLIVGDIDGVVVIPAEIEDETLERSVLKALAENEVKGAIIAGMTSTQALAKFGVL